MGAIQNSALGAIRSVGVALHANDLNGKDSKQQLSSQISEANDASKNELMAQKAAMNAERLKALKLKNKRYRLENRILKKKEKQIGGDK